MARAIINVADSLILLFNLLKDQVIGDDIGGLDVIGLPVLIELGRTASRKSYAYCFRGGTHGKICQAEYSNMNTLEWVFVVGILLIYGISFTI